MESNQGGSEWKTELLKLCVIMGTAVAVLGVFILYPTFYVVVVGVLFIAAVAYLSERKGGYNRVLMIRKAVLVTGCDTGIMLKSRRSQLRSIYMILQGTF